MRAEIAKYWSESRAADETLRLRQEKLSAEVAKLVAETQKLSASLQVELLRLNAEATQIRVSTFLAPALAAAGLMGATAAIVQIFF
ncbi:MAG: hypothetical protein AAF618_11710 [Pseudomonadota bacterium]